MSFSPTRAYNGRPAMNDRVYRMVPAMNDRTGRMVVEKGSRIDLGSCNVCQTRDFDDIYRLGTINWHGGGISIRFCPRCLVELKKKLKSLP